MRSKEKHLNHSPDDLLVIMKNKLEIGRLYYHCMSKGIIYNKKIDDDYIEPLIDVYRLTGKYSIILNNNPGFIITTGISKEGLEYMLRCIK